jgi:hypothetical protein
MVFLAITNFYISNQQNVFITAGNIHLFEELDLVRKKSLKIPKGQSKSVCPEASSVITRLTFIYIGIPGPFLIHDLLPGL